MRSLLVKFCLVTYLFTLVAFVFLAMKVIDVRSKCTRERQNISSLVSKIKSLKDENSRLLIEFYREVRPGLVDKKTQKMEILHENGVKYLK